MRRFLASLALLLAAALPAPAQTPAAEPIEIFDAHLHYNWEPTPYFTLAEVHALFKKHRVTGILATSRPNDGTHALVVRRRMACGSCPSSGPTVCGPMCRAGSRTRDLRADRAGVQTRLLYRHRRIPLSGRAAATETVRKTVNFAVQHDLFLHAHADEEAVEILFQHNPKAKIIWAHTGFGLGTERVEALLKKHPMLWGELSYRSGITGGNGVLSSEWRDLFTRYPNRFLVGSDTWINERWASYGEIMAQYRGWLNQLPPAVAARIAHGNARALFEPRMQRR